MAEVIGETESLCPVCLRRIPAIRVVEHSDVYLNKTCPTHGRYKTLIWRDVQRYHSWGRFGLDLGSPESRLTETNQGCPYDCGLCPAHRAKTCVAVLEITSTCNLNCPVCFASSNENHYEPDFATIRRMLETLMDATGPCPVQLSGGEPTTRDDLPQIIRLARDIGFGHIEVNTNGLRIANDREYLYGLKDVGASTIFLQFDGVTDDVYRYLRGRELLETKFRAIENCAKVEIGVILVPTLVTRVNDQQVGDMVRFAKKWIPVVKGIHFQPMSYFGRFPKPPTDDDRITIPDLLLAFESQTGGEIKGEDFLPRRRKESYCAFAGLFVLMEDGKLMAATNFKHTQNKNGGLGYFKESPADHVRKFLRNRWTWIQPGRSQRSECGKPASWEELFERARAHYLSISCMPFQDVWNIDLERLQRCCTHIVTADRRIIPLCAFHVTSISGERLHWNKRG